MTSLLTFWACACSALGAMPVESLPVGSAPKAIACDYFPSRLHAFVWRNWECVNLDRMAQVVGASTEQVAVIGTSMGLPPHEKISDDQLARGYISVIRRNWHLLPYDQLLALLGWDADKLAYTLREDDFLWLKLGSLKPVCSPVTYAPPDAAARQRSAEIKAIVEKHCGSAMRTPAEPRFAFVRELAQAKTPGSQDGTGRQAPGLTLGTNAADGTVAGTEEPIRFLYSYFALFGDPLIDEHLNPYPDGLLERLRGVGVNGVWLHVVLRQLAPAKDFPEWGEGWQRRLANLRKLVDRADRYGVKVYLYMNEPRAMPNAFFTADRAGLKGVNEGDYNTLCTSTPAVREWVTNSLRHVFTEVPNLGGVFTITGSENLTHCWSHGGGDKCPRCSQRKPEALIAELNQAIANGVHAGNPKARVLVWDWGWPNEWCDGIINALPKDVQLMSVSEWDLPIARGGVSTTVTEYSLSGVGPGPRAKHNWEVARKAGIKTVAKIQANITWELSAVPYLPVMDLVAQHCEGLNACGVDSMMLSWSLGGYPSPNLELVNLFSRKPALTAREALTQLARQRYGVTAADDALAAWSMFSKAFAEFPYHGGFIYSGPMQVGPANPLYLQPTGYHATMVGFPYDELDAWRAVYPAEVLADQLEKVAAGWQDGLDVFNKVVNSTQGSSYATHAREDTRIARAAWIHLASAADQTRFIIARKAAAAASQPAEREPHVQTMRRITETELKLAQEMFALTREDSRIGYEASNHYYYYPFDLAEKIVNCDWVLRRLPR